MCNGERYELEVGVCSRGGDQSAIEIILVPKGGEQEVFCRSEWEEEVQYSRVGTMRLQLKHLLINKQAGENDKIWSSFHLLFDFINHIKLKVCVSKDFLKDCLQIAGRTFSCPLALPMVI